MPEHHQHNCVKSAFVCSYCNRNSPYVDYMHQLIRRTTSTSTITNTGSPLFSTCSAALKQLLTLRRRRHSNPSRQYDTSSMMMISSADVYTNNKGGSTKNNNGAPAAISTVFFDLDNTLIATRKADTKACNRVSLYLKLYKKKLSQKFRII